MRRTLGNQLTLKFRAYYNGAMVCGKLLSFGSFPESIGTWLALIDPLSKAHVFREEDICLRTNKTVVTKS